MKSTHIYLLTAFTLFLSLGLPAVTDAGRAEISLDNNDKNGDGRISAKEWKKKEKIFKGIDANEDGFLSLQELRDRFGETASEATTSNVKVVTSVKMDGLVDINTIDNETLCGIARPKN